MAGFPLGMIATSCTILTGTKFTVASPDEGFAQQLGSFYMKFANAGTISVINEARNAGTTFSIPDIAIQDNDVCVSIQCSFNNSSTALPTKVVPTGFTEIDDITLDTGNEFRVISSYKKLSASDRNTTITGMNSESDVKFQFIIRGASDPTISVGSVNGSSSTGETIAAQTVTLPSNSNSSDTEPIMVFAVKQSRNDDPLNDYAGLTGSDGLTRELYRQSESSRDANRVGYYLNNNGLYESNVNVPVGDIILYCPFNDSTGVASNATVYLSDAGSQTFVPTNSFWSAQAATFGISGSSSTTPQIINTSALPDVGTSSSPPPSPMGYTTCYNGGGTSACIVDTSSGSPSGTWLDNIAQGSFNNLSIEFYFYIGDNSNSPDGASTGAYSRIFTWGDYYANDSTTGMGFSLEFMNQNDDDFQIHIFDTGSAQSRQTLQVYNLSKKDWHYYYSQVDVQNQRGVIRVDNQSSEFNTSELGSTWTPYASPLKFGQHIATATYGFDGGIAELIIRVDDTLADTKFSQGKNRGVTFLDKVIKG